ncbi:MAG: hypothetical protein RI897_3956 [Verrucomicrobiota bacterium]
MLVTVGLLLIGDLLGVALGVVLSEGWGAGFGEEDIDTFGDLDGLGEAEFEPDGGFAGLGGDVELFEDGFDGAEVFG